MTFMVTDVTDQPCVGDEQLNAYAWVEPYNPCSELRGKQLLILCAPRSSHADAVNIEISKLVTQVPPKG